MKLSRTGLVGLLAAAALALSACGSSNCGTSTGTVYAGDAVKTLSAAECAPYLPASVDQPVTASALQLSGWEHRPEVVYFSNLDLNAADWTEFLKQPDRKAKNAYEVNVSCPKYLDLTMLRAWTTTVPGLVLYTAVPAGQPINVYRSSDPLALVQLKLAGKRSAFLRGNQLRPEALHQPGDFASELAAATNGVRTDDVVIVSPGGWGTMTVTVASSRA